MTQIYVKPFLVEFLGPPGAGKSTICRELNKLAISSDMITVVSCRLNSFKKNLSRTRIHYFTSIAILNTKYRDCPYVKNGILKMYLDSIRRYELELKVSRDRSKALVRDLLGHLRVRNMSCGGIFVTDEGLARRGVSALLSGIPRGIIKQHYDNMPLADLNIHLEIDALTAASRWRKRDGLDW